MLANANRIIVFMPELVPVTLGQQETPIADRVVATVITIDVDMNMATLRTEEGKTFELPSHSLWHVGHKLLCDRRWGARLEFQNCQRWEANHPVTSSGQVQSVPRR